MADSATIVKVIFIVVCFAVTMGAGLAPMKLDRCTANAKMLSLANSFAGGVFLAIAFAHILPEACNMYYYSKLKKIMEKHHDVVSDDSTTDFFSP